jgi:hypothetical protein
MRLVASVFPLSGISAFLSGTSQSGEKAPWHDACGHDSAAERTIMSAALSFHDNLFDGRLRPAAIDVCGHGPRERRLF